MSGRGYLYSNEMNNYTCGYDEGAYDAFPRPQMTPATSSSGTSGSSLARPVQRYPQTASACRRLPVPAPRTIFGNETCLSSPPAGPSAGQMAAKYRSMAIGSRGGRNAGCSPGGVCTRTTRKTPCDDMGEAVNRGAPQPPQPAKRTVQFPCGAPSKQTSPGTPSRNKASKPPKNACSINACPLTPSPASSYKPEPPTAEMYDPDLQAQLFGNQCTNMEPETKQHCSLQEYDEERDEGFISKLMKKIKGPGPGPANPCPLKVDVSSRKRNYGAGLKKKSSFFSKQKDEDQQLEQLHELWNPDTFMRWKCVDNWDQHKESLWRSVIQARLDCPESHNRGIDEMMSDAFKAMNAPGGECISYRMIYGVLRRNEDMYLNPYIPQFSDDQFIKLIISLNRFYMEDKDKRKLFFDHPPPTFIEKIMMKETLMIIDPSCPVPTIARRFWELLLDWYAKKIHESEDELGC